MVAAADRPLIDVLLLRVPGIKLQPVGSKFLTDGEARAHPAAADVVVHGHELIFLQTGFKFVVGRRSCETGCERRLAGLDQLDRATDFLGAVGRRQDLVIVLFAAKAAAKQALVHVDLNLLRLPTQHFRQIGGQGHAREGCALRSAVDVPGTVDELHRCIERLHRRVAHHVGGVLHFQDLLGSRESFVDITFEHPIGAGRGVLGRLRKFREQVV